MSLPSSRTVANHKSYDPSSPPGPSSRRTSKITVEYHKPSRQSIREYEELLSNVNLHAAAAANYKDPFVPSRQAPPPPISHHASKPSKVQDPSAPHHKSRNSLQKPPPRSRGRSVSTAPTTIHEAESDPFSTAPSTPQQEFSSFTFPSTKEMATHSMPPTPPRPSRANTANLTDLYPGSSQPPVHGTAPPPHLDGLPHDSYGDSQSFVTAASSTVYSPAPSPFPSFSPPADRIGTSRSRSATVTAKGKKGMLGFMTDFLNSNRRPEISTPYDPVHLTHVGFNSSTGEFTGLPKEWQQLLQDSGISRSDQEKNPLAVMEIVKFYQEGGGGDVWDKMVNAPAPGGSQSPPIPGILHPPHFAVVSKSVDDSVVPTVSVLLCHFPDALLKAQSDPHYRHRKRFTQPARTRRVRPDLTLRHRIGLRHLLPNLPSPISTGRTRSELFPNQPALTLSSARILRRTGALRRHRRLSKRPSESHRAPRLRILR